MRIMRNLMILFLILFNWFFNGSLMILLVFIRNKYLIKKIIKFQIMRSFK